MKLFLIAMFSLAAFSLQAQDTAANNSSAVVIHKDARLDLLVKKQIEINEITTREARKTARGFRLLVVNTNNRDEAIGAKTKLYEFFPELKSYLYYQTPYFKVKAGNFKEKKDAEAYQKKLNSIFPKGVFIMADVIEIKLDEMDPVP
jgi:hypothetical protein